MPRRRSFSLALAATVMAFLGVLAYRGPEPASPEARLPQRYRLADLIERQQDAADDLRAAVEAAKTELAATRSEAAERSDTVGLRALRAAELGTVSGMNALRGPGLQVTLDDSDLRIPPEGATVNDLVIHSQDVQAVVNALWRAGAEGIAINGERLVATSAVLCVGNTLLLNGTVHSPPYVVSAVGATRDRFENDRLVRRLKEAAEVYGIDVSVKRASTLTVPAFDGATTLVAARPVA